MAQTFKICQFDGSPLLRIQEFMSSRTRVARRFSSSEPSKSGIATRVEFVGLVFAPPLSLTVQAKLIEGSAARHGQQPRDKRPAQPSYSAVLRHSCRKTSCTIFGCRGLLKYAQDQRVHETGMAVVQLFKRAYVPLQKPPHERRVWRHVAGIRGCENRKEHVRLLYLLQSYT
jgi:hypothetical protein